MAVELAIAREAELDTTEACIRYEGRRSGLGEKQATNSDGLPHREFLSSVDARLESIRRRPEMYPVVHELTGAP